MKRLVLLVLMLHASMALAETLSLEGEIGALDSAMIAPPTVSNVWNFQITQIAAEGSLVKAGEPVVTFDGTELQRRLAEANAQLKQAQSELAKLLLTLAEREQTDRLAVAEQLAALKKATRKSEQPAGLIRSVDYQKLVIERNHATARYQLVLEKEKLATRLREAELSAAQSDVARAQALVDDLNRGVASLTVLSPRDGTVVVRANFQGDRFDVGGQVFVGQPVAEVPNPGSLVVRATVPERDMLRLAVGMPVQVRVQGGNSEQLRGRITELGRAVRSKSRLSPVPVLDVLVEFDGSPSGLKTGSPVLLEVEVAPIGATK